MSKEIEVAIDALLQSEGISVSVRHEGERIRDSNWKCDAWRFTLNGAGKTRAPVEFEYFTGTGLRKAPPMPTPPYRRGTVAYEQWENSAKPVAPPVAGLLHSFCMDDTRGAAFEDWASEYGYDTDSRKALDTYHQCQNLHSRAVRFFGRDLWDKIVAQLEGY